jgi:hypothetical protein
LSWQDVTLEDGYILLKNSSANPASAFPVANLPLDQTNFLDTGLLSGETYYYWIKAFNTNGNSDISTCLPAKTLPDNLIFWDDFESASLGSSWQIFTTVNGRAFSDTHFPMSGSRSVLMDCNPSGILSTGAIILTLDLKNYQDLILDFWWREFTDENDAEDGVFIRSSPSASWGKVFSFNNGPESYVNTVIRLDSILSNWGVTYSSNFQIKFQYYDNYYIPSDGYSIDNVVLSGNYSTNTTDSWLDSTPPTVTCSLDSGTYSGEHAVDFTAFKDPGMDAIDSYAVITLEVSEDEKAYQTYTGDAEFQKVFKDGHSYKVLFHGVDARGNQSPSESREFVFVKEIPAELAVIPSIVNINKTRLMRVVARPRTEPVDLKIYTIRGDLVAELPEADLSTGICEWTVNNRADFPAGRYILRAGKDSALFVIIK